MAENYYGSICLSDIPKELITTAKNGKKYLNIVVNQRKEAGQYGHTHYIKVYAKKGTVDPNTNLYIGELKPSAHQDGVAAPSRPAAPSTHGNEDLPF